MSVVFLVAMTAGGYACLYCILAHAGNFAFLAVLETTPQGTAAPAAGARHRLASWGLGAFALVTGLQLSLGAYAENRARGELDASTQQIIEATRSQGDQAPGEPFIGRYLVGELEA